MTSFLLLILACGPKELPPHLRMGAAAVEAQTPTEAPTSFEAGVSLLVGSDPLVRRPPPLTPDDWENLDGGAPIAAWSAIAVKSGGATAKDWEEVESRWRGSIAVPLARGARLASLEAQFASTGQTGSAEPLAATWLGPLSIDNGHDPTSLRPTFDWLAPGDAKAAAAAVLAIAERRVLLGWLDGPDIPLDQVAKAMKPGVHDRLSMSPAGTLIQARAAGSSAPAVATSARDDLVRATTLALQGASADRDSEQVRWKQTLEDLAAELGTDDDPLGALLVRSREGLTTDASADPSAGAALLAMTAERIRSQCPEEHCGGIDRVTTLGRVIVWDPALTPLAASWQVVALKHALDHFEVTHDRPSFARGLPDLADAIVGSTGGSIQLDLLRQGTATPTAFLLLSRAAGGEQSTEYEGARTALRELLVQVCERALATELADEQQVIVEHIRKRAAR